MYSIKMRSSKDKPHEKGGKHISGAERIVSEDKIENELISMYRRAITHERGKADFINLKVEKIKEEHIVYKPLLKISCTSAKTKEEGLAIAKKELKSLNIEEIAIEKGINLLNSLKDSMHGAMILNSKTGERLDKRGIKGVRATKMGSANHETYEKALNREGYKGEHVEEALILASKVAGHKNIIAELCWSDDPDYVTGYVGSSKKGYTRIPIIKDKGNPIGGRIFFVNPNTDLEELYNYLEEQVVLIK